jgi:hypothetical protein
MRVKLIDVDNRLNVKYSKSEEVYNWGDDNCYPQLVESLIGSSVTAKVCADLNAKYIYGKGFEFAGRNAIVNKDSLTVNQLFRVATQEFSKHNNLFFHVNYNALYEITSVNLLLCINLRIGKSDSTGYSGRFIEYNNWDKCKSKSIRKADFKTFDKFNPIPEVIEAQVVAAGGWSKYKGQVLHINSDYNPLYSYSDADSALLSCYNDHKADGFITQIMTKGFIGQKIVTVKPFTDDYERSEFDDLLRNSQGTDKAGGIILLEANMASDVLAEQLLIQNVDSNIDDKMFNSTSSEAAKKIRTAFGVPAILIDDSDNSIFGQSGELLKVAKQTFWEDKEEERNIISEAFQRIFSRWHEPINPDNNWNIIPKITLPSNTTPDA